VVGEVYVVEIPAVGGKGGGGGSEHQWLPMVLLRAAYQAN